tara:strand:- start:25320 stop:25763 length:444 start_codon:yes stop_codon:yes gene_type:complete
MKNLKSILLTFTIMTSFFSFGQEIADKMQTTTVKTFQYETSEKMITYKVKVIEKRKSATMGSNTVDPNLEHVTKLISIDNDSDKAYDRYIVLRYKKTPSDSFKLVETKKGFAVLVDNTTLEYLIGEGTYTIDNKDNDYFVVDEFDNI